MNNKKEEWPTQCSGRLRRSLSSRLRRLDDLCPLALAPDALSRRADFEGEGELKALENVINRLDVPQEKGEVVCRNVQSTLSASNAFSSPSTSAPLLPLLLCCFAGRCLSLCANPRRDLSHRLLCTEDLSRVSSRESCLNLILGDDRFFFGFSVVFSLSADGNMKRNLLPVSVRPLRVED